MVNFNDEIIGSRNKKLKSVYVYTAHTKKKKKLTTTYVS